MNGRAAVKAGLNLSTCPTCTITSASLANLINFSASSSVCVIGFSINTCLPLRKALEAIPKWAKVGVTISIQST